MTVHERQQPPAGHGEVLCAPAFEKWPELLERNAALFATWPARLQELRAGARTETVEAARAFSETLHVTTREEAGETLVVTGHQPELYHPGVWIKDFLVQRASDELGATALDLVVDTDVAGRMEMKMPCLAPEVRTCRVLVAEGHAQAAYAQLPPPDPAALEQLRRQGMASLDTLPAPALSRHFATFCNALDAAAVFTPDLASCMTAARRIYERPAGTDYLELAVSVQARTSSYRRFVASLLLDAFAFREAMNTALAEYRRRTGTRSVAQPFPDLSGDAERVDAPFWLLAEGTRMPVSVSASGMVFADSRPVADLGKGLDAAVERIASEGLLLAPKALALTLFQRLFVADLFVHGTGGGRYDRVTDAVIAGYYGVTPPAFAIASMTLLLPLGGHLATAEEVTAVEQRLHRFTHNPDQVLDEVEFDTMQERERAEALAEAKRELVDAIAAPGADRKALGGRIRQVNEELGELLRPMVAGLTQALERVRAESAASGVLTDRTYPYCLWDPREVMDKVR